MKILAASSITADSNYANAINFIKIADGFAKLGHEVKVVCREPRRGKVTVDELRKQFHLCERLTFVQVPSTFFFFPLNQNGSFANQVTEVSTEFKPDLSYCRNYVAPVRLAESGIPVIAESHAHPGNTQKPLMDMVRGLIKESDFIGLITISPVLKNNFISLGVPEEKIFILPDAVDNELFKRPSNFKQSERENPVVVYSGHLYDYKGIPTILSAAKLLPDVNFKLVGGHEEDVKRVSDEIRIKKLTNLSLTGHLPHSEVPQHLWNADVLLLPPSGKHPSAQWTSPVKLGEYLASGTPVVATKIPALNYWLTDKEVKFVEPDNPESLAKGIRSILENPVKNVERIRKARELAQKLSYERRCERMLRFAEINVPEH